MNGMRDDSLNILQIDSTEFDQWFFKRLLDYLLRACSKVYLQHKGVWRMYKIGDVAFRRALQAKLRIRCYRVVHEHNCIRQLTIVKHLENIIVNIVQTFFQHPSQSVRHRKVIINL